jgi:hypothetical protein
VVAVQIILYNFHWLQLFQTRFLFDLVLTVVGIMLVLFIGSDEEIKKAERYILESNEEYKEVVLP